MARKDVDKQLEELFQKSMWAQAQKLLENERTKEPENHWLLTQLGVTFYEQKKYEEALKIFLESLNIVPNCPLTLWNLAGTLDALGKPTDALRIYTWLLESKTSPKDDPCWESKQWTDSLKTDALFRMGGCFEHLGKKKKAEHCFRQYLNLLLSGAAGTYSVEEVTQRIRSVHGGGKNGVLEVELRKAVASALQVTGIKPKRGRRSTPPTFDEAELLAEGSGASNK